ncbi:RNA polymerase-associated protein RapA [Teredinibacter sp. KSP-S5-2]|uniref:RNA polymerase-associated protein RapA n=1 Tax=Teredinibacter sp. KSP-S5-2 TaxID=3034506 RepID=UPI002934ED4D|nr:RNA polymerase-associated protein RapA [Teredinibacter sp. KSP-S5-2]WNO09765.1 RNA polymerase-associated protein RapA [Teredinibacter sp. KSP-S5-2]
MSATQFFVGQRWISDTEASLGLGIIAEIANRRVTISFPAAAETRVYAADNAPLSRVRFQVGDTIRTHDGEQVCVSDIQEHNHCYIYFGESLSGEEKGNEVVVPELELDSFVSFSAPQARLFSGQIDKHTHFSLRSETLKHLRAHQESPVTGLLGARVQPLPHQMYIAHTAAHRHAPRVLLADEVGLGKTIEAGLILHQQLISGRAERALIVVPDSLVHQWLVEMIRRFNLHFTIIDEKSFPSVEVSDDTFMDIDDESRMSADAENSGNPFESAQLILSPLSFLVKFPEYRQQAVQAGWDLLLVDEAHHLKWSEQEVSEEYQCVEALSSSASGLLLLTATPEQLGIESHFARLKLLDPDRYFDLAAFIDEEKQYQPVNELVQRLLSLIDQQENDTETAEVVESLKHYLSESSHTQVTQLLSDGQIQQAVEQATRELMDRHGTGRVLFRNTRMNVSGFPARKLHTYPFDLNGKLHDHIQQENDLDIQLKPEKLISKYIDKNWPEQDDRVQWLMQFLRDDRQRKVLLICAEAKTAIQLESAISFSGVASSVFHEGLNLIERDRAAAYFADEEGAQILVCSEIGSEGRNFQFAHNLVLFDIPLNPDLLEQRIGRLDRIGQRHQVNIHVPYYRETAQASLLNWYHQGLNGFEKTCATGRTLYEKFGEKLLECLQRADQPELAQALIEQTQTTASVLEQELQAGRDQLLEVNSCNITQANEIIDLLFESERRHTLSGYMGKVFDEFGVDQDSHSATSVVLHPGDHMLCHHFPGLPEAGITATFHRETALSREDMIFLSWEHPMVTGVMDMIAHSEFGNTAVATIKLPSLKPGTILLETLHVTHCPAPKALQLFRYLPITVVRTILDPNGRDLTEVLAADRLESLLAPVQRHTAQQVVQHSREVIEKQIKMATDNVEQKKIALVNAARENMLEKQNIEINRLQELAKVNPNIRAAEIDLLKQETEALLHYLDETQIKLDSLRVIVSVN